MAKLNINSDAVVQHTARLERISRSALPVAIRQTLNKAAYDVKTDTMPAESDVFVHRTKTFFKANSKVDQAKGFDVNEMKSTVGFKPKPNDTSHSVEDLQEQEEGGDIKGRAFIATASARTGGRWDKNVRAKNRLSKIRSNIIDPRKNASHGKGNGKGSFIKSAIHAGKGGFIMNQSHDRVLEIKNIKRVGGNTKIDTMVVDTIKAGRKAHVRATHFMKKASNKSAEKMEGYFIEMAEKQINKIK